MWILGGNPAAPMKQEKKPWLLNTNFSKVEYLIRACICFSEAFTKRGKPLSWLLTQFFKFQKTCCCNFCTCGFSVHLTDHPETFFFPLSEPIWQKKKSVWITSNLLFEKIFSSSCCVIESAGLSPCSALHDGKQWNLAEMCAVWLCLYSSLGDGRETLQVIWAAGESQVGVMP